ncbi:MAG: 16S rRNA processing protein RimM [Anaerolineales bacterium]|nr:16S rRNA processing protein RimM [Anaerolineales bacterium]
MAVARVRRPFGVKGELLLEVLSDFPGRLTRNEQLYAGDEQHPLVVENVRRHGTDMLLQLQAVRDRDAAEKLRGMVLSIRVDDLPPLPAGVYYLHQIEGLEVVTEQGERLGRVKEILKTGANDVYVVQGGEREILLPAIPQVIREVRLEEGKIIIRMMEGLV